MTATKTETPLFQTIFSEALASIWLPIFFFLNIFLTGFLVPTDYYESGYNSHHWDFIYGISGALSLLCYKRYLKNPSRWMIAFAIFSSGLFAAYIPYLWALLVLPHGIPDQTKSLWVYAFNAPAGQIVIYALMIGAVRYGQRISNSVAENRIALNYLRSNMQAQVNHERNQIIEQMKNRLQPALNSVEFAIISGSERDEIANGINNVIADVVRPLSHEIDASATQNSFDLSRRDIKRDFLKQRFRRRLRSLVPLRYAFSAPLSIFCYINFNLSVMSSLHGFLNAFKIGALFLALTAAVIFAFNKYSSKKEVKVFRALICSIVISILQALNFYISSRIFNLQSSSEEDFSFAFVVFFLTLGPAIFEIILFNMRANLQSESELNNQIAQGLSTVRRQLWGIRKKFAREIHGGLQSRLQVLALRISKNEEPSAVAVSNFYKEFEDTLTSNEPSASNDLKVHLEEFTEFWSGLIDFKVAISEETYSAISHDYFLIECLQEVMREAIINAVKHAGASEISITLTLIDSKSIQLTVTNNIKKKTTSSNVKQSLGTSIFKELSNSWELSVGNESTTLSVNFTLS